MEESTRTAASPRRAVRPGPPQRHRRAELISAGAPSSVRRAASSAVGFSSDERSPPGRHLCRGHGARVIRRWRFSSSEAPPRRRSSTLERGAETQRHMRLQLLFETGFHFDLGRSTTKQQIRSPLSSSGTPTAADSATVGWAPIAPSTSARPRRLPARRACRRSGRAGTRIRPRRDSPSPHAPRRLGNGSSRCRGSAADRPRCRASWTSTADGTSARRRRRDRPNGPRRRRRPHPYRARGHATCPA
jgi:hypothetical protein